MFYRNGDREIKLLNNARVKLSLDSCKFIDKLMRQKIQHRRNCCEDSTIMLGRSRELLRTSRYTTSTRELLAVAVNAEGYTIYVSL